MSIDTQLEKMLRKVEKPARYTGGEVNSVKKNPAEVGVRIGFAFPDTYEIGMSYMGMQILYNILNIYFNDVMLTKLQEIVNI